jgi:hypothetical protein
VKEFDFDLRVGVDGGNDRLFVLTLHDNVITKMNQDTTPLRWQNMLLPYATPLKSPLAGGHIFGISPHETYVPRSAADL